MTKKPIGTSVSFSIFHVQKQLTILLMTRGPGPTQVNFYQPIYKCNPIEIKIFVLKVAFSGPYLTFS